MGLNCMEPPKSIFKAPTKSTCQILIFCQNEGGGGGGGGGEEGSHFQFFIDSLKTKDF